MDSFFFIVSKTLGQLSRPSAMFAFLLVLGVGLLWSRWQRAGKWILGILATTLVIMSVIPVHHYLAAALERHFPIPVLAPGSVDGIIILGGYQDAVLTESWGQPVTRNSSDRLIIGLMLARRHPHARIAFTAGSGRILNKSVTNEKTTRLILDGLGVVDKKRTIVENKSRNTHDNANNLFQIISPSVDERWVLVTSAYHLPRAVAVFRNAGWNIIPYPSDYRTPKRTPLFTAPDLTDMFSVLDRVSHEYIGLIAYRLMGYTSELFPQPMDGTP